MEKLKTPEAPNLKFQNSRPTKQETSQRREAKMCFSENSLCGIASFRRGSSATSGWGAASVLQIPVVQDPPICTARPAKSGGSARVGGRHGGRMRGNKGRIPPEPARPNRTYAASQSSPAFFSFGSRSWIFFGASARGRWDGAGVGSNAGHTLARTLCLEGMIYLFGCLMGG